MSDRCMAAWRLSRARMSSFFGRIDTFSSLVQRILFIRWVGPTRCMPNAATINLLSKERTTHTIQKHLELTFFAVIGINLILLYVLTTMTSYKLISDMPSSSSSSNNTAQAVAETEEQIMTMMEESCLNMSKFCSIAVGMIIGIFIQASSLGTSLIMTTLYGKDVYTTNAFVVVSLAWCLVAAIMGVVVMLLLRNLVVTAFYAVNSSIRDAATLDAKEAFMLQVISNMEHFFAVGSLVGVGVAWLVTDFLLKMEGHACHSVVTVGLALVWCKYVVGHQPSKVAERKQNNKPIREPLLVGKDVIIAIV